MGRSARSASDPLCIDMKKWLALLTVIALVCVGWYYARNQRVQLNWRQPKTAKVDRGEIRVPITAAGLIEPKQRYEVKSEASGEVMRIHVQEGDYVHSGDVLVELDPDDEQRNLDRAESDLRIAEAQLADARTKVVDAEQQVLVAEATLANLKSRYEVVKAEFDLVEKDKQTGSVYSPLDYAIRKADLDVNLADQKSAEARLEQARNAVQSARIAVQQHEHSVKKFQKAFEDAQERLRDTVIKAPQDGIVTDVHVAIGEKIQSGTSSFTGGTVLLQMADVSSLKVVAKVDEADYGKVADIAPPDALPAMPGQRERVAEETERLATRTGAVTLTVDAFPDEKFEGRIVRVEPQGRQPPSASVIQFDVHVEITGANRNKLPLGAQAQVEFTVQTVRDALRVPTEAVKSHEGELGVWIVADPEPGQRGPGQKFVPCRLGISDGEFTEVIGPRPGHPALKEGQEVYTKLPVLPEGAEENEG